MKFRGRVLHFKLETDLYKIIIVLISKKLVYYNFIYMDITIYKFYIQIFLKYIILYFKFILILYVSIFTNIYNAQ